MPLNVIIAGAGEVGRHAAEVVSLAGHNLTVIELSEQKLRSLDESLDVRTVHGNCTHLNILKEVGVEHCDLMIAATRTDEINMLCAAMAKIAGAKKTVARVHHSAFFNLRDSDDSRRLGIDLMICPEYQTALEIARVLRNPGAIALEDFARGKIAMQRLTVDDRALALNKTLAQIELPSGARVATVERGGGALIANAETKIEQGDIVTLIGEQDRFEIARKVFQKGKAKHQNVVIMGGTAMAVWLCRALKSRIFSVRLFVRNRVRAEEVAAKLGHVTVVTADPTDPLIFEEEKIGGADVFLAVDADDERNMLACAQAKSLGAKTCIAVIQHLTYMHLLEHVGIDRAFSPHAVAARVILKLVDAKPVRSLATLADGVADVYEVDAKSSAKTVGHELRNIKLPGGAMIAAVQREDTVRVPVAGDNILAGDKLLVIGPRGIDQDLSRLFAGRKK